MNSWEREFLGTGIPVTLYKVVQRKITKKELKLNNTEAEGEGAGDEDGGASDASDDNENEKAQVGSDGEDKEELQCF